MTCSLVKGCVLLNGHRVDVRAAGAEEGYDILVAVDRGFMDRPPTGLSLAENGADDDGRRDDDPAERPGEPSDPLADAASARLTGISHSPPARAVAV